MTSSNASFASSKDNLDAYLKASISSSRERWSINSYKIQINVLFLNKCQQYKFWNSVYGIMKLEIEWHLSGSVLILLVLKNGNGSLHKQIVQGSKKHYLLTTKEIWSAYTVQC